jgi:hypothetical protein
MNKTELLDAFSSKNWVHSLVNDPTDTTPTNETPQNLKWYQQVFYERNKQTLIKRKFNFYVINEGKVNEEAYYQENEPLPTAHTSDFRDWLQISLTADMSNPKSPTQGFKVVSLSEDVDRALVMVIENDPGDPDGVIVVGYLMWRDNGILSKKRINGISSEVMAQYV